MKKKNTKLDNKTPKTEVYLDLTDPNKSVEEAIKDSKAGLDVIKQSGEEVLKELQEEKKDKWHKRILRAIKKLFS